MSEAVKRYDIGECNFIGGFSKMLEDEAGEYVLAADHDRIVAELIEASVEMQARVDRLTEESIKDHANYGRAFKTLEEERDQLAGRCRELEDRNERVREHNEFLAEAPNRMGAALRAVKEALGLPIDASVREDLAPAINTLRAEVERLRIALSHADTWIEAAHHGENCFVSNHYDGDPGSRCNCGKDSTQEAIEAALRGDTVQVPAELTR